MHKLEDANIPILGPLIDGHSRFLDGPQQWSIAVWSVKTCMVLDSATASATSFFYTQEERDALRESSTIPLRTTVWLGQFHGDRDVGANTSEIRTGMPNMSLFPARVSTFLLGCLVIQVTNVRLPSEYGKRTIIISATKGPWDYLLTRCWPADTGNVYWPPPLAMNFSGTIIDFRSVADRFNEGANVPLRRLNST